MPPSLILTGQHPELDLASCGLNRFPAFTLGCAGQWEPHLHVEQVFEALFPFLKRRPDLVIVQGDTSSALGGALAAVAARVPLAHVEAGLRSHDIRQPWPEEEYRCRIDAEADLLFAPSERAAQNLRREHAGGAIHVTGNTGIDALLETERRLPSPSLCSRSTFDLLVTCHRRENWGNGLASLAAALTELSADPAFRIEIILHPNPDLAKEFEILLEGCDRIRLSPPCSHAELIAKMRECDLLLSDSGGMQEEAPALGTPLLVLRERTERPEGVESGNARLVGMDARKIVESVQQLARDPLALAAMSRRSWSFGDGRASERIAAAIEHWLGIRTGSHLRIA